MAEAVAELRRRVETLREDLDGIEAEAAEHRTNGDGPLPDDLRTGAREVAEAIVAELNRLEQTDPEALVEFAELRRRAEDAIDGAAGGVAAVRLTQRPRHPLTDLGNAERFRDDHAGELLFVHGIGWHRWDSRRFAADRDGERLRAARDTARSIREEGRLIEDKAAAKAVFGWAVRSESRPRLEAAVKLAESEQPIAALPEHLDSDPDLLVVANGALDLATGELRAHSRADLATRLAPVEFDPDADCPTWLGCLETWLGGEVEPDYLQRAVGYSLSGHTSEQCLFLLDGEGANGKTTFLETIGALTGDYGTAAEAATFMAARAGAVRTDLARLRGRRFVRAAEVEDDARFAEVLVKQLTGGDAVVARFLYRDEFEFRPAFKLWIAANRLPSIRGTDHAIWRRIRRVPFPTKIERPDRAMGDKLRDELPGILAWAVAGGLEWRRDGLGVPPAVREATQDYRRREDGVGEFLRERCERAEGAGVTPTELRGAYEDWCGAEGIEPVNRREFASSVSRVATATRTKQTRLWSGIALRGVTR